MLNDDIVVSFKESADHKEFIVKIKKDLTWHDGMPFTAHDIVFSWNAILDEKVPCPAVKVGTDQVTSCLALDDQTIKYVQDEPLATRLWNIYFPIIPKHIFMKERQNNPDLKTGEYYNMQNRNPIGNGPYRFVEWLDQDNGQFAVRVLVAPTAHLPSCTSPEVVQLLEQVIRGTPVGASAKSIDGHQELSYDRDAGVRHGQCVVHTDGDDVNVKYLVEWLDRDKGHFLLRILDD